MNSTQKIVVKRSLSLLFVGAIASSALFASSAQAATSSNSQRTISLTTTATLNVVPDTIAFTFTLTDTEKNNDTAYSTVSGLGNKITALLKEQGIASVNITSSTVSLSPIYDYSNNTQTLTGYQANQNFKVVLRNMKTAPTIMTKVIDLGGNAIIVNSTNTYVYNSSTNDAKLRARVVAKARATATSYAHLLGDKLKNLVSLSENPIDNNPMPIYLAKASSTSGDTTAPSINVGIQTLSVTISTVWAIV